MQVDPLTQDVGPEYDFPPHCPHFVTTPLCAAGEGEAMIVLTEEAGNEATGFGREETTGEDDEDRGFTTEEMIVFNDDEATLLGVKDVTGFVPADATLAFG
jgi:hypothetical protein